MRLAAFTGGGLALLALWTVLALNGTVPGGAGLRRIVSGPMAADAGEREALRQARIASFASSNELVPAGSIVFLGSSTIEFWPLETSFPGRPCLNRGIGAESITEIAARLDQSLPRAAAAGIVLYVGSADLRAHRLAPATIVQQARGLLATLRARCPEAPIAVLGVLPGQDLSPEEQSALATLNAGLRELAGPIGNGTFVATDRPPFMTPGGSLDPALARDRWHLNAAGYRALTAHLLANGGAVASLLAR